MNFYKIFFFIAFMLVIGTDLSEAGKSKKKGGKHKGNKNLSKIATQAIQTGGEIINTLLNRNQGNRNNNRPPMPYENN
ncbi:hypothetical protein ACLKA6_002232 [Drosophila palustris]